MRNHATVLWLARTTQSALPVLCMLAAVALSLGCAADGRDPSSGATTPMADGGIPRGLSADGFGPTGTCDGACGGQATGGCWCDELCTGYGDCCRDYQAQCLTPPDPCEGVICEVPGPVCEGERLAVATAASCNPDSGACETVVASTRCEHGCGDGQCLPSPCEGVICEVPAPVCDGEWLITATDASCNPTSGECETVQEAARCEHGCAEGACELSPCENPNPEGLSLQERIDRAEDGDVLYVGPEPVSANVTITDKTLTLVGDCSGTATVFRCANDRRRAIRAGTGADITIEGFVFEGCDAGTTHHQSGVVHIDGADAIRIRRSVFRENSSHRGPVLSTWHGSAMADDGVIELEHNVMHGNRANDAGVIYVVGATTIRIVNNLIFDNHASDYCAAVWLRFQRRADLTFQRATLYDNSASRAAALCTHSGEGPLISSSLGHKNRPRIRESSWGSVYSVWGRDPGFVDPEGGDFTLRPGSEGIDRGEPGLPPDADGSPADRGVDYGRLPPY